MRAIDLKNKKTVIWGTGREGIAAAQFIRRFLPQQPIFFVDESAGEVAPISLENATIIRQPDAIAEALDKADVVIKSPGVSLYHPLIQKVQSKNVPVTSLLNLWMAEPHKAKTIGITGTKGKSTTTALLTHILNKLGKRAVACGNIGTPITDADTDHADFVVVEISSYQAANFDGMFDLAVLTSLYPEHLDWHKSLESYYRDKLNLLKHARTKIINAQTLDVMHGLGINTPEARIANTPAGFHIQDGVIFEANKSLDPIRNNHLARQHNLLNVCTVLTILKELGFDPQTALAVTEDFQGLPHREHELGIKDGILYVDDSISTTPQSAIAAMECYRGKPITLIAGGYDRGIDYTQLINYVLTNNIHAVICMGPSGERISATLKQTRTQNIFSAQTMPEVVAIAKEKTPSGGVILLSPAAPSYGLFKDFIERGKAFAKETGF